MDGEFCARQAVCKADVGACVCPLGARAVSNGCQVDTDPIGSGMEGPEVNEMINGTIIGVSGGENERVDRTEK